MKQAALKTTIANADRPVVVEFWAPWCAPCRQMAPILDEVSETYRDTVLTIRVNADEDPESTRDLQVVSIPTIVVFDGGQERARRAGAQNRSDLAGLYEAAATGAEIAGLSQRSRFFRIAIAAGLAFMATEFDVQWPLLLAAGAVFFSAIHDRCPVWQAIKRVFENNAA
jgi:thioredoxin 1